MSPDTVCINLNGTPVDPSYVRSKNTKDGENERHYVWKFTDPRNVDISGGFEQKREPKFHNGSSIVSISEVRLVISENNPENSKIVVSHDNEATVWTNKKLEDNIAELFDKNFAKSIYFTGFDQQQKGKSVLNCTVKPTAAIALIATTRPPLSPSSPVRKRKRTTNNIKNLITKSEHFTRLVEDIQKIVEQDFFERIEKKDVVEA